MKTFKLIKTPAMLAVAVCMISLSGCTKKPNNVEDVLSGSDKTQSAVSAITVNVKTDYGAAGNGIADDTDNFNAAITAVHNAGGGTVYVPVGTYLINPEVSINMKSNVLLDMVDSTRIIKVKTSDTTRYNVIRIHNRTNSQVKGGKILGERYTHIGTAGEWGMGISIYGSTSCKVINTVITDCWGDGIVVGSQTADYNAPNQSVNCVITGVKSRNNRRQGLTIGGVDSLIVVNCTFTHTNGAAPQAGIDIEPDQLAATKIHIKNCEIAYNTKAGILMVKNSQPTSSITKVTVEGNTIHHNTYSGYMVAVDRVKFYYNLLQNNDFNGSASGGNGNPPYVSASSTNVVTTPNTY
jgi:hypothetical protein